MPFTVMRMGIIGYKNFIFQHKWNGFKKIIKKDLL